MNKSLTRSIGFWLLLVLALASTAVGGWLISGQIGTMTTTLLDGTATGIEVYVGQSLVVVGAVVLGGPAWSRTAPVFLPIVRDVVTATTEARRVHEVDVRGSALGDDAAVVGAACLVLEHAFSARPATLLIR